MEPVPIFQAISRALLAAENCAARGNTEWEPRHRERASRIAREFLPSGSGIDCGTVLDDASTPERLRFVVEYHHMNASGCYAGWKTYTVTCKASLAFDIDVRVTGGDRDTRDYLADVYQHALQQRIDEYPTEGRDGHVA